MTRSKNASAKACDPGRSAVGVRALKEALVSIQANIPLAGAAERLRPKVRIAASVPHSAAARQVGGSVTETFFP